MPQLEELQKEVVLTIDGAPIEGASSQPLDTDDPGLGMPDDGITPPFSLEAVAALSEYNPTRKAIIEAIARNTVGLGISAEPPIEGGQARAEVAEQAKVILDYLDACSGRDTRMESPTFLEHLYMVKTDEEACGQGGLEVSRNRVTGRIDGFFYVPGKRIRRLADRSGYLIVSPDGDVTRATRLVNFGTRCEYDEEGHLIEGSPKGTRNELLIFRLHTTENRDYGAPRDLAMLPDYTADRLAAEANIGFFDSGGTPPTLVFVGTTSQGAKQSSESATVKLKLNANVTTAIGRTLRSDSARQHRVALLPLPENGKVEQVQLGKVSDKDVGYVNFRKDLLSRQLSAFRLSRIFISTDEGGGRYDAEVQRALTLEQVFDPEQVRYEKRLHRTIMRDLGFDDLVLKLKRLAVESDQARRDSAESLATVGAITNREMRAAFGYGPLPEHTEVAPDPITDPEAHDAHKKALADKGMVPKGWNDSLVSGGANVKARPSEKSTSEPDNRGLKDGTGGRPPSDDPKNNENED